MYDYYFLEMKEATCIHCPECSVAFDAAAAAAAATHSHTHAPRPLCALVIDEVQEPRSPRIASLLRLILDCACYRYRYEERAARNVAVPQCQTRH